MYDDTHQGATDKLRFSVPNAMKIGFELAWRLVPALATYNFR
jgi:hypothetical protein